MQQPARAGTWIGVFGLSMMACTQSDPLPQQGPAENGGRAYALLTPIQPAGHEADAMIVQRVQSELARDPVIGDIVITVQSAHGRVHLRGFVGSNMHKLRAQEIVQGVGGVTRVDNGLITRAPSGAADGPLARARIYL